MSLGLGFEQGLYQKLIMTPELKQAIKILELPTLELTEYLRQEALDNPVLEMEENLEKPSSDDREIEPDWLDYFDDRSDLGYTGGRTAKGDAGEQRVIENGTPAGRYEGLFDQLSCEISLSEREAGLIGRLIWNLDDSGYLPANLKELAEKEHAAVSEMEKALAVLQSFEPAGVGARSLSECLQLQCRARGIDNPVLLSLIDGHLDDLSKGRFGFIETRLGCSAAELKDAVSLLKTLSPHPGLTHELVAEDGVQYVISDVVVQRVGREFVCYGNDGSCPKLTVSRLYRDILKTGGVDRETADYVKKKVSDALRLIRNIDQRRSTILRVAEAIVSHQEDFMRKGSRFLRPLTLKEVADKVGVHESTVSRAVNGKYMETPLGIFEMRYFFVGGVKTAHGESASSVSVKKRISELVASESADAPLTDDGLATLLRAEGVRISRRTVAKYRDELRLPPSTKRHII